MSLVLEGPALLVVPIDPIDNPFFAFAGIGFGVRLVTPRRQSLVGVVFSVQGIGIIIDSAEGDGAITVDEAVELKASVAELEKRGLLGGFEDVLAAITAKADDGAGDKVHFEFCSEAVPVAYGHICDASGERLTDMITNRIELTLGLMGLVQCSYMTAQNAANVLKQATDLPLEAPQLLSPGDSESPGREGGFVGMPIDLVDLIDRGDGCGPRESPIVLPVTQAEIGLLESGKIGPVDILRARVAEVEAHVRSQGSATPSDPAPDAS